MIGFLIGLALFVLVVAICFMVDNCYPYASDLKVGEQINLRRLAMATGIPLNLLVGESPGGLNVLVEGVDFISPKNLTLGLPRT